MDKETKNNILARSDITADIKQKLMGYWQKMATGEPFIGDATSGKYLNSNVHNLFISVCFNCNRIAVWVNDKLIFPALRMGPDPNSDMPLEIADDFQEARAILNLSPRGSAALLRLCVQKLCVALGEKGKNIDDDIAKLVKKGLNPLVQKALDIVRVIGNEAVHPGLIDLKDDPDTANRLFDLVNAICDQMISHPKYVNEMYEKIPPEKRAAIERRDGKS